MFSEIENYFYETLKYETNIIRTGAFMYKNTLKVNIFNILQ